MNRLVRLLAAPILAGFVSIPTLASADVSADPWEIDPPRSPVFRCLGDGCFDPTDLLEMVIYWGDQRCTYGDTQSGAEPGDACDPGWYQLTLEDATFGFYYRVSYRRLNGVVGYRLLASVSSWLCEPSATGVVCGESIPEDSY